MKSAALFEPLSVCMEEDWKIPLIGLSYVDFLTPREKNDLVNKLRSPAGIFECSLAELSFLTKRPLRTHMWKPREILDRAERTEKLLTPGVMGCIFYWDSTYPSQLRFIFDPPLTLFFRGTLPENGLLAGIVGTRFPSGGARKAAFGLGFELGRQGIGVVSGLAKGVDREAHEGCVMAGGYSIAVLGSGVDIVYPPSSAGVGRALLDAGGAILSEYPPGTAPLQFHFPARNRIICGLSHAVVVVQAPERSGALITATYAAEEGRSVYVHSAGVAGTVGTGTRCLAEAGATVISGAAELMQDWGLECRPAGGQAARPGETTGQALSRITKGEMEGACATKAGVTYWRT